MSRRRWLERGVIVIAALATIATKRRGWELDAQLGAQDRSKPRYLVVEASNTPTVELEGPEAIQSLRPEQTATWPGTARFLVPAGFVVKQVWITGHDGCKGCGKCEPPDGVYVRIAATTPIATWRLEASGSVQTTQLDPKRYTWSRVSVTATGGTPRLRVESKPMAPEVSTSWNGAFSISWPRRDRPDTATWTPHVVLEGACPDTNPCEPPAEARLSIDGVTEDHAAAQ